MIQNKFYLLMAGVISLLAVATVTGLILKRFAKSEGSIATVDNLNLRINAWWSMIAIFVASYLLGSSYLLALMALYRRVKTRWLNNRRDLAGFPGSAANPENSRPMR